MASEGAKAKRILQVKIRIPSADTTSLLTATMKNALSIYGAFGHAQVRLLRNANDRNRRLRGYHRGPLAHSAPPQILESRRQTGSRFCRIFRFEDNGIT